NMVLKSGTNRLHGAVFEYLRNEAFDARSFFDPVKLPLRRNQFGGTVTGPVLHDKLFFMLSEETYLNSDGETRLNHVPTPAERAGDFSNIVSSTGKAITIKDPLAGNTAFPGGIIPTSRFSPIALNLMRYYPLPNYTGVGLNYQATSTAVNHWASLLGKADYRLSNKDTVSARYGYRWNPSTAPWTGTNLGGFGNRVSDNRLMGGITHVHSFSAAIVNEFRAGVSRNAQHEHIDDSAGQPTGAQLGMAGSTTVPLAAGFPRATVTNYATLGYANNEPVQFFVSDYQIGDVLTWIRGKHILKFGGDISIDQFNQPFYNNQRGSFTANGVWTGNGTAANGDAFADLMLGLLSSSTITQVPTRNYLRWRTWGAFVNDDFRVTPTLTLNLGLRYEIDPPPHEKYNRLINFVPELNKVILASETGIPNLSDLVQQAGLTGRTGLAKDFGLPSSLVFTQYKNFAPRFGFAWRPAGGQRTVVRGGYGWFYSGTVLNQIRLDLGTSFPFSTNLSFNRVSTNPAALTLTNPWPVSIATLAGTNTSNGFQVHAPSGYAQNYNLTIERMIGGNVLEIGYVGSKGTHLGRRYNINLPFRTAAFYMQFGTGFPVPYPPLSTINYYEFGSNSIYNAGQIMFQRRASGSGFFYRLGYTYSKSIDDASQLTGNADGGYAGALDPRNLSLERARSDTDRGHVFTAIFSYPLPLRGKVISGWQLSGTVTAYTGPPFTIEDSSINTNIGQSDRPNRVAAGKDISGAGRRGLDYPWYAVGAFVPTADCASRTDCSPDKYGFLPFAPGNSGRNILDGPGTFTTNATLLKNFRMKERRNVQVRWEVFNIFNKPNFMLPNRNYNETSAGIISGVQDTGRGGPRTMQFALKYIF
ncbi:MAG: TonB-dependent receptor, partial [Proteobacteria bacterium]|nr:TonB-dependent receptor [Pseudomonadota bacterium]